MLSCATTRSLQGHYRPLVKRAWAQYAADNGIAENDRTQYEAWYRGTLRVNIGVETTAGATPAQMQHLIEVLEQAVDAAVPVCALSGAINLRDCAAFSKRQNGCFKTLVAKAWRKVQATDPSVDFLAWFEARWRDTQMHGGFGGTLFDRAMCLFGVIAGDEFWIRRTAEAQERRMRHVIRAKLAELSRLTKRELDWSYVQGIFDQAKMVPTLDDCPAEHLRLILQTLGSAIAREMRKQGISR